MTSLAKTTTLFSLTSVCLALLLAFVGYEKVAKRSILSQEIERLRMVASGSDGEVGAETEVYDVVAKEGALFFRQSDIAPNMAKIELFELAGSAEGLAFYRSGWVYFSKPVAPSDSLRSEWKLYRSNVWARLNAALGLAGGGAVILVLICHAFFYFYRRSLSVAIAREVDSGRKALGLDAATRDMDALESVTELVKRSRDRIDAETERAESLALRSAIASNATHGVFICDEEGRIEWINEGFTRLTGYALDDLRGGGPFSFLSPSLNDPLYLSRIERSLKVGERVELEVAGRRPDGSDYWTSLEVKPLVVDGEPTRRFLGIQTDITKQHRASMELEKVSRRFALAMESANVGIWDWDVKKDVLVWDDRVFEMYGVTKSQFRPCYRGWMNCIHQDETNRTVRAIDQCLANGENIEIVMCVTRGDGSKAYIKNVGRAFQNDQGEVIRYIGIASDVTTEFIAETSLIEQKDEAESLAIRLAEAVKQAKRAAAEADKATRAKSAFLAMMSHEIRTPMNGVVGMASLLLETELDEHQRDYLNTIRMSGDTLLTLINDILDYSKIESGKLDIELAPFSVRECVEDAVDLLASKAAEKGIGLISRVDLKTPETVVGDITRLRQVVVNLLGNAIKFTDVGEVELRVHAPENGKIAFSVRDTGIGIPQDRMNRLFEVFSQVDSSTTRKYGGSGLGLSISKQLTNLMGGEMWVESQVGKGSVFHFDIVFEGLENVECDPVFRTQKGLKGKRLMVVEPNAVLRDYIRSLGEAWGMEVDSVASLSSVKRSETVNTRFDYVVLDQVGVNVEKDVQREQLGELLKDDRRFVALVDHGSLSAGDSKGVSIRKPVRVAALLNALKSMGQRKVQGSVAKAESDSIADPEFSAKLPLSVLVADDNSVNQKVARMMLRKFGYDAEVVANGLEAVEAVKQREFDLIFMDCQMPEMDGYEATRMIREIEKDRSTGKHSYIFALTANVRGESMEMSMNAGMDGFLAKPIRLGDIKQALDKVEAVFASRN